VATFRHPKAVAQSLATRKNLSVPMKKGYELWKIYNLQLIELYEKNNILIINFDLPGEKYLSKVEKLADAINLNCKHKDTFFDPELKSQSEFARKDCPPELLDTYDRLLEIVA